MFQKNTLYKIWQDAGVYTPRQHSETRQHAKTIQTCNQKLENIQKDIKKAEREFFEIEEKERQERQQFENKIFEETSQKQKTLLQRLFPMFD